MRNTTTHVPLIKNLCKREVGGGREGKQRRGRKEEGRGRRRREGREGEARGEKEGGTLVGVHAYSTVTSVPG